MKLQLFGAAGDYFIQCQVCSTTGPYGEEPEIAGAQWNNNFREKRLEA